MTNKAKLRQTNKKQQTKPAEPLKSKLHKVTNNNKTKTNYMCYQTRTNLCILDKTQFHTYTCIELHNFIRVHASYLVSSPPPKGLKTSSLMHQRVLQKLQITEACAYLHLKPIIIREMRQCQNCVKISTTISTETNLPAVQRGWRTFRGLLWQRTSELAV